VIQDLRLNYEKVVEQTEHLEAMIERQTKNKFLKIGDEQNGGGRMKGK
jgi:hypothetical protein